MPGGVDVSLDGLDPEGAVERLRSVETRLTARLDEIADELLAAMRDTNPLDLAGLLYADNCMGMADSYRESEHTGSSAFVEYAVQLALTQNQGLFRMERDEPFEAELVDRVQELIEEAFDLWSTRLVAQQQIKRLSSTDPDELVDLRFKVLRRGLRVRNPCYEHHSRQTLKALADRVGIDLRPVLGFTFAEANTLTDRFLDLYQGRLDQRFAQARELTDRMRAALVEKAEVEGMRLDDPDRAVAAFSSAWVFYAMSRTYSISAAELAECSGVEEGVAAAYLKAFSIGFGDVDSRWFRHPNPTPPVCERPLVEVKREDGLAYFCSVPMDLRGAVRPRIEVLLNPSSASPASGTSTSIWHAYERAKKTATESETMARFIEIFGANSCFEELKYRPEGAQSDAELDGLVVHDRSLLFVEVKGGRLKPAARRAAPKAMLESISKLVGEAHSQAERAMDYVRSSGGATFVLRDGTQLRVDSSNFDDAYLITVSLEPLDSYVTNLHGLQSLGILSGGRLPWAVYLEDLRVIADLVEGPTMFTHYLRRRARVNQHSELRAHDELDWFGNYLAQGLYFEDELSRENAPNLVLLSSFTEVFDDYYLYKQGIRTSAAPRPKQEMPTEIRSLIRVLERRKPSGYLDAGACLLEMGGQARTEFVKLLRKLRRSARRGNTRDFSFMFSDIGLTFAVVPPGQADAFATKMESYIEAKARQNGVSRWIGLVTDANNRTLLRHFRYWRSPGSRAF